MINVGRRFLVIGETAASEGPSGNPELLTLPEAARLLRLQVSTLRDWVLKRRIAYVKVGRLVRIRRCDVEALIAASIVPARQVAEATGSLQVCA
jgi:excisionase family DNA binding protein